MTPNAQYSAANRAIARTADAIEKQLTALQKKIARYDAVAPDYSIERLMAVYFGKYPAALMWLERQHGEASMRLAEALKDWLALWSQR
jgi:hypothetical protein